MLMTINNVSDYILEHDQVIVGKKFKMLKFFKESKRTYWPIPMFFKQNINLFDKLLAKKIIYYEKKFGIYLAYTSVAVCKKLKG